NNTNNIYGVMWQAPLLPEEKLRAGLFGAGVKEGYDSPDYPTYLYGMDLSSRIRKVNLTAFYIRLAEQEEAIRYNSILQSGFSPSRNTLNKFTAKASKGTVRRNLSLDMDTDPVLEISIVDTGDRNIAWELEVDDGNGRVSLQYITAQAGVFKYKIRSPSGWSGLKSVNVYLSFYNSPDDLSDNSIYVDYIRIFNSSRELYEFEDFSSWIIPDDVTVEVLDKTAAMESLPRAYFPFQAHYYGLRIRKEKGDTTGLFEVGLNDTKVSPVEEKKGYQVRARLDHMKHDLSAGVQYDRVSRDFDIGALSVIPEPQMDLRKDEYFSLGPASFFGSWVQEYVEIVAMPDYLKLTGEGGQIYKYFDVDLDKYPVLSLKVGGNVSRDFEWAVYAEDDSSSFQLDYSSRTGIYTYDIKALTGWRGKKHFRIRIKKGKEDLYLYWVKFWRTGVERRYGYGEESQLLNTSLSYKAAEDFVLSSGLKLWDQQFSSYHFNVRGSYDILHRQENLVRIYADLSRNRGEELMEVEAYPRLDEYFGAGTGMTCRYKGNRFEIPQASLDYGLDFQDRDSVSLLRYNFGVRYLMVAWLGYTIQGRDGKIIDSPLQDTTHVFSLDRDIPVLPDTTVFFKYALTFYINWNEKEWQYNTNMFEAGVRRKAGFFQSLLDLQYRIGESGKTVRNRYSGFLCKLEVSLFL
ncbi:MAG: hypothetical protein PHF84_10830, partial [bacterium]|nr:hypothetical protein [bacterium]